MVQHKVDDEHEIREDVLPNSKLVFYLWHKNDKDRWTYLGKEDMRCDAQEKIMRHIQQEEATGKRKRTRRPSLRCRYCKEKFYVGSAHEARDLKKMKKDICPACLEEE